MMTQLSTPYTDTDPSNSPPPKFPMQCASCSCDIYILLSPDQNFPAISATAGLLARACNGIWGRAPSQGFGGKAV